MHETDTNDTSGTPHTMSTAEKSESRAGSVVNRFKLAMESSKARFRASSKFPNVHDFLLPTNVFQVLEEVTTGKRPLFPRPEVNSFNLYNFSTSGEDSSNDDIVVYGKGEITVLIDELFAYIDENKHQMRYHSKPVRPYGFNTIGFIKEVNVDKALDKLVTGKRNTLRKEKAVKVKATKEKVKVVEAAVPSISTRSKALAKEKPVEEQKSARFTIPHKSHLGRPSKPTIPLTRLGRKRRIDDLEIEINEGGKPDNRNIKRTKKNADSDQKPCKTRKSGKRKVDTNQEDSPAPISKRLKRNEESRSALKNKITSIKKENIVPTSLEQPGKLTRPKRPSRQTGCRYGGECMPRATKLTQKSKDIFSTNKGSDLADSIDLTQTIGIGQNRQTILSKNKIPNISRGTQQPTHSPTLIHHEVMVFQNAEQQRLAIEREMETTKRKRILDQGMFTSTFVGTDGAD